MGLLSQSQKDAFWNDGVLVVEGAVSDTQLEQLRSVFTGWVEESRLHTEDYGCLLYTSPSPRDRTTSRMPSSA